MALATFKDIVIDAVDAHRLGTFWAEALGLDLEPAHHGVALRGPTPAHGVWINEVPEAKTVKHRVHLDVHTAAIDELVALGATVIDADSFRWSVMADPEGGEFCAFERGVAPDYRLYELSIDVADPEASARWWIEVLGGEVGHDDSQPGWTWIEPLPGAPFDGVVFAAVEEPKVGKNRVHFDLLAPSVAPLLDAGAQLLRPTSDDSPWSVLADPDGNEFCVFTDD